ncbi:Lysophospholipid transporter LplT [Burkholderia glumae]|nr:Lysophospholipid transporter LplT [Burkholderia glumae]
MLGGALISPHLASHVIRYTPPWINTPAEAAMLVIMAIYVLAALFNLRIPDTGARYPRQQHGVLRLVTDFADCFVVLWRDKLGQISLAVTTLFWGAGATLQFIVLKWAEVSLGMSLSEGAILQAVVALGVAGGAMAAASRIPLKKSLKVLPVGIMMGIAVMLMAFYTRDLLPAKWVLHVWHVRIPSTWWSPTCS